MAVDEQCFESSSTIRQVVSRSAPRPPCSRDTRSPHSPAPCKASRLSWEYCPVRSVASARGTTSRRARSATRSCHSRWVFVKGKYVIDDVPSVPFGRYWENVPFGCKCREARATLSITWQTCDASPGLLAPPL